MFHGHLLDTDLDFLRNAAEYLESPSFLMKLADMLGKPLEFAGKAVPAKVLEVGNDAVRRAMSIASQTIRDTPSRQEQTLDEAYHRAGWTGMWHMLATMFTGGVGGALGLPGLALELPITTSIMFRSFLSIANDFGMDHRDPEVRFDCLAVFAYGGLGPDDDAMESSYITTRLVMAQLVRKAATFVASNSSQAVASAIAKGSAPAFVNLFGRIAASFNVRVAQKFLAQSIPVIGIAGGATINAAFMDHFNKVAKYHFGIQKLEQQHGVKLIREEYQRQLAVVRPKISGGKKETSPIIHKKTRLW